MHDSMCLKIRNYGEQRPVVSRKVYKMDEASRFPFSVIRRLLLNSGQVWSPVTLFMLNRILQSGTNELFGWNGPILVSAGRSLNFYSSGYSMYSSWASRVMTGRNNHPEERDLQEPNQYTGEEDQQHLATAVVEEDNKINRAVHYFA